MAHVVSVCEETMMNHSRPSTLLYASVAARRRMQVFIWVFSNGSLGSFLWAQEEICLEWLSRKLSESEYSKSDIGPACRCVVTLRHKMRPNSSTHHVHTSECFHDLPQVVPLDVYADCILISRKCLRLLGMNRADWVLSNLFTRISDNTAAAELVVSPVGQKQCSHHFEGRLAQIEDVMGLNVTKQPWMN